MKDYLTVSRPGLLVQATAKNGLDAVAIQLACADLIYQMASASRRHSFKRYLPEICTRLSPLLEAANLEVALESERVSVACICDLIAAGRFDEADVVASVAASAPFASCRAAFDAVRDLVRHIRQMRQRRRTLQDPAVKGTRVRILRSSDGHLDRPHCELCWRLTAADSAASHGEAQAIATASGHVAILSQRFCDVHTPGRSTSDYRKDLRRKRDFREVLSAMNAEMACNSKVFLATFGTLDTVERRRLAFSIVHDKPARRVLEICRLALVEDMPTCEIARRLAISRQAVHHALKHVTGCINLQLRSPHLFWSPW